MKRKTSELLGNAIINMLRKFGFVQQRAIIDVETWDGAASNYSSTEEYCKACLINVNEAAGNSDPDDWTQSMCKLPIRSEEDSSGDFVRQAVFAAAGGRGISAVTKPTDVPQEAWDSAVRNAANQLIGAYEQMDEVAPDGIFEAAGREPPERAERAEHDDNEEDEHSRQRALSEPRLWQKLGEEIYTRYDAWLMNIFHDSAGMYAIAEREGGLWKFPFTTTEENVLLGESVQVTELHAKVVPLRQLTTIRQQADGRYRWMSVSCTAVLNRVGEIDGTELFEAFERRVAEHGYPPRKFYHQKDDAFRTGQTDFVARRGFTLVTSGLYDDSELARREIAARQADGEYWGESLKFEALAMEVLAVNGDTLIPVFTDGFIMEISTLPEREAAAWGTRTFDFMEVNRMALEKGSKQWDAFVKLFGDDETAAEQWLSTHPDSTSRDIQENVDAGLTIARETPPEKIPSIITEINAAPEAVDGVIKMREQIMSLTETVNALTEVVEKLSVNLLQATEDTATRLGQLERTEETRRSAWVDDLPAVRSLQEIHYRPRQDTSSADIPDAKKTVDELLAEKGLS